MARSFSQEMPRYQIIGIGLVSIIFPIKVSDQEWKSGMGALLVDIYIRHVCIY